MGNVYDIKTVNGFQIFGIKISLSFDYIVHIFFFEAPSYVI